MVHQIAKDLYCIEVPLPNNPLRVLNSYFLRGEDHDLLIDTGFRREVCRAALEEGLRELGSDSARRDVLATHFHADHSGMADLFAGPNRRIYMREAELDYMKAYLYGSTDGRSRARFRAEGFPEDLLSIMYDGDPAEKPRLQKLDERFCALKDGEALQIGEYRLQVVPSPGHTPGNMMLWEERTGMMLTGDHVLFDITPNITAFDGVEDSLGDYLASLQRVRDYPVRLALPSHRKSGDYRTRIDALLRHHQDRLEETLGIVRTYPDLTAYEIAGKMTWRIRASSWVEFPVTQKWFAVGECLSHLDYLRKRGLVMRCEEGNFLRYRAVREQ